MKLFYAAILILSVFASIRKKCTMGILPEFCNDKADPRCTTRYYLGSSGLSIAEKYPSEPRDIKLDITDAEDGYQILNLTWKPPNDSSISQLLGYDVGIPGLPYNFLYDLTEANFTLNDSEILFSFACKLKRNQHLIICFHSLPIPMDNFYCRDSYTQPTKVTEIETYTYNPALTVHVPNESRKHKMLWYLFLGPSIFVLTIIIFALFLLKKNLFGRDQSTILEDELQRINEENDFCSEEEDGEV